MDIKEALDFEHLKYFFTKYIKPLRTRVSQLGTAANCTVVNNTTTTTANTVLDGRIGNALMTKFNGISTEVGKLSNRVDNHVARTGAECSNGGYKYDWNLKTDYDNIGNSWDLVDNKYYKSFSEGGIQVKEGGLYLVLLQARLHCTGDSIFWSKLLKDGVNMQDYINKISGDYTFQGFYCGYLTSGQKLTFVVAKSNDSTTVTVAKNSGYIQAIKLT